MRFSGCGICSVTRCKSNPALSGLVACAILEDSELPSGIVAPTVGERHLFMRVELLYPGVRKAAASKAHILSHVNGRGGPAIEPVHGESLTDEDGVLVSLIYRIDDDFDFARLESDGKALIDRVELD